MNAGGPHGGGTFDRRLLVAAACVALGALVALAGCSLTGSGPPIRERERAVHAQGPGVPLYAAPQPVLDACRRAQGSASATRLLCPRRLPRLLDGRSTDPPPLITASVIRGRVTGKARGVSVRSGDDGLAFEICAGCEAMPSGGQPRELGGRTGVFLAPAASGNDAAGRAWFTWSQRGTRYTSSLADLGPRTLPLLDSLLRTLRPVSRERRRAATGRRTRTFRVPVHGPVSLAVAGPALFVAGQGAAAPAVTSAIVRMSAGRLRPLGDLVELGADPGPVAIVQGEAVIWVVQHSAGVASLRLLDPGSGRPIGTGRGALERPVAVAVGYDAVWIADRRRDPSDADLRGWVRKATTTDGVIGLSVPAGRTPAGIATGAGSVWVTNAGDGTVTRIDPVRGRAVSTIRVGKRPVGVTVSHGAVWVANSADATVSRIDPRTDRVTATVRAGRGARALASDRRSVWVANALDDTVTRIDAARAKVRGTTPVGAGPVAIAAGPDAAWVANSLDDTVTRIRR